MRSVNEFVTTSTGSARRSDGSLTGKGSSVTRKTGGTSESRVGGTALTEQELNITLSGSCVAVTTAAESVVDNLLLDRVGDTSKIGFRAVSLQSTASVGGSGTERGAGAVEVSKTVRVGRATGRSETTLASTNVGNQSTGNNTVTVVTVAGCARESRVAGGASNTTGKGCGSVGNTDRVDGSETIGLVVRGKDTLVETSRDEVCASSLVGDSDTTDDLSTGESSRLSLGESGEREKRDNSGGVHR